MAALHLGRYERAMESDRERAAPPSGNLPNPQLSAQPSGGDYIYKRIETELIDLASQQVVEARLCDAEVFGRLPLRHAPRCLADFDINSDRSIRFSASAFGKPRSVKTFRLLGSIYTRLLIAALSYVLRPDRGIASPLARYLAVACAAMFHGLVNRTARAYTNKSGDVILEPTAASAIAVYYACREHA
jgi:hypothetical protein